MTPTLSEVGVPFLCLLPRCLPLLVAVGEEHDGLAHNTLACRCLEIYSQPFLQDALSSCRFLGCPRGRTTTALLSTAVHLCQMARITQVRLLVYLIISDE
jgi:hypothetical protein